ncbi:putative disease resistance protein RGA4 [Durio zibethinus]|uniref:Disease resistance protein RGA4 n=1 Tax=Durio zibethinus TaxID=66656 RepID=A0A6P5X9R1_DURZI|nr:putative disease resistance protein RGA4 [Durio zibethinus]
MASFLFDIAERVLQKLELLAVDELHLAFNVKCDLRKLKKTMSSIKAVLLDAERQQQQNEKLRLCMWELRDIFCDAEDVLDEFECEAIRKQVVNHPSISIKVRFLASCSFPLSFSLKVGHKIREIHQTLDKLATEWNSFNVGQGGDKRHVIHRETYSSVNSSDVIGRDVDKENIIKLLTNPSEAGNLLVIPIVGIGGLGKTTLAQFVYDDDRVTRLYPSKIWVCVSEEFNLTRLLKLIIHSINKEEKCDVSTVQALQTCLRSLLNDKKFLLILDDVWNEDRGRWIELRNLLKSMGDSSQSKIIVTTRSRKVAKIMSSIHPYELDGLPPEQCLTLFAKWAFNDGDERQHPNLMRIGEEIVKKCKGVPLAVRTLGSLLFSKTDEFDWISVRDDEIWRLEQSENDILPVLKLSYNHLPSHLQRCFAFLSLYPKDQIYTSYDVIQFWMANGLLEYSKQKQEWEHVGRRYLNELLSRCLIQKVGDFRFGFNFKMHDLIHDLALDVSQKECKTVNYQTENVEEKIRHLSFCEDKPLKVPQILKKLKNVRTVIVPETSEGLNTIDKSFISFCVSNFKYLRELNISNSSLGALPNSIGNLKHLRYLNLNQCYNIRKLPRSFYKLRSLLTLTMEGVPLMQLPDSMQSLIELRYLEKTIRAKHLKEIRPGCWSSLQYLTLSSCDNLECLSEGMQFLTSLRALRLFRCYKLVSLPRSLKFLTKLEGLYILGCRVINLQMEPEEEKDKDLQLSLRTFSVWRSGALTYLPRLLLEGSSTTLQHIEIGLCNNFEVLPAWLQNLTSLHKLEISHCLNLSSLPEGMDRLTELRQLEIRGCPVLSERCRRDGGADWHKIAHVQEVDIIDN